MWAKRWAIVIKLLGRPCLGQDKSAELWVQNLALPRCRWHGFSLRLMYRLFLLPDVLLEQKPWAEVRRAVEGLLAKLKTQTLAPSPERLQVLRAMEVLEHIGSSEARDLLQRLAKGAAEAQLTQQAKASLQRLDKRAPASR